jgi:hypothetical protein
MTSRRPWPVLVLLLGAVLALVQQQALLRRAPRLVRLEPAPSGPPALRAHFSRPMDRASLQQRSRLQPARQPRWLGEGDTLLLSLGTEPVRGPLELELAGRDRRGLALGASPWRWDPRGRVLAVVPRGAGEQLQLQDHDGRWLPLGPIWHRLPAVEALGDGSGVAFSSEDALGNGAVWQLPLAQANLSPGRGEAARPRAGAIRALEPGPLVFAHLSSNRRGDLLVQSAGGPESVVTLQERGGRRQRLDLQAGGTLRLLPEGGGVVVPTPVGLALRDLPPRPPRQQLLPGSRDLLAFCPRAGRALLLRHWPDYRRSIERIEPGQPPRPIWLGQAAVLGGACAGGGERVWLLLLDGLAQPEASLVALDGQGRLQRKRRLVGWEVEPGAGLHYDPASQRLLTTLRPLPSQPNPTPPERALAGLTFPGRAPSPQKRPAEAARPVVFDATDLTPTPLAVPARRALWLPAG